MLCRAGPAATKATATARPGRASAVVCRAEAAPTRRSLLATTLGWVAVGAAAASAAQARDYKEALAQKEARRAKLRGGAGEIKASGKDKQIMQGSSYEVSEEARTPNIHSRQNEGARTQENI